MNSEFVSLTSSLKVASISWEIEFGLEGSKQELPVPSNTCYLPYLYSYFFWDQLGKPFSTDLISTR